MTNIYSVFQVLQFITDKARQGLLTSDEASYALDMGQQRVFDKYWIEQGEVRRVFTEALLPFLVETTATTYTLPTNMAYVLGVYRTSDNQEIRQVLYDELSFARSSALIPITDYPRYLSNATSFQLYGVAADAQINLKYLRRPNTPLIATTTDAFGNYVYNSAGSVQLDFAPNYYLEIIEASLPYIGVNLNSQEVLALSQQFQKEAGSN